jgi:hypothetical protein
MLQDSKARGLVDNFAGQWLQLRTLPQLQPDKNQYPLFTEKLRQSMKRETELFFETIIREDRSILDFLDADFTWIDETLAAFYGIEGIEGDTFQRVLARDHHRGGLLTQGSILTITSNPTRTSPVKRGKWVLENILGTPPPPPPPDAGELNDAKQAVESGSLRKRMELHRAKPICASCHSRMDPIGFGFENFDAIGHWREKDGNFDIDSSGELFGTVAFKGPEELKRALLGHREEFARCFAEKLLTYALGRGLEYYDKCAIDQILKDAAQKNYKVSAFFEGVVRSVPFQYRRGEATRAQK